MIYSDTPPIMILVATYFDHFLKQPWQGKLGDYLTRVLVWGAIAGTLALNLSVLARNNYASYQQTQERIDQIVRPGEVVLGTQVFWFGLYRHPYYSWELLFYYPRFYPGKNLADAFAKYHPDVLIIDQGMRDLISDSIDPSSRWYNYHVSTSEMQQFLDRYSSHVDHVNSEIYGVVDIYHINWQNPPTGPNR